MTLYQQVTNKGLIPVNTSNLIYFYLIKYYQKHKIVGIENLNNYLAFNLALENSNQTNLFKIDKFNQTSALITNAIKEQILIDSQTLQKNIGILNELYFESEYLVNKKEYETIVNKFSDNKLINSTIQTTAVLNAIKTKELPKVEFTIKTENNKITNLFFLLSKNQVKLSYKVKIVDKNKVKLIICVPKLIINTEIVKF